MVATDLSTNASHDLVILSDLHLGEGLLSDGIRTSPMEDFFYDDAFARLLAQLQVDYRDDPQKLVLVLNGDIFDFLTVTQVPSASDIQRQPMTVSRTEMKFGLDPTPSKSLFKLNVILDGHRAFFSALSRFVAAGFRVEILRGNHDLELFFAPIQQRIIEFLSTLPGGPSLEQAQERVHFHQWFYMEPRRVYIEHGNQYEASNSIRYPLRPILQHRRSKQKDEYLDYPLGSLFVRYFYNRVHKLDPYTRRVTSFEQYLDFVRRYNLIDLVRVAREHYRFFLLAAQPAAGGPKSRSTYEGDARQESDFEELEESTQPSDLYRTLNKLKVHPMAASKLQLVKEMTKPLVRRLAFASGVALFALYFWLLIFNLIQATPWLAASVFAKAILMVLYALMTLVALLWAGNYLGHRLRQQSDEVVEACADRAEKIARATDVKMVCMGHTHIVDHRPINDGRAVYANGGTWISVDNPWNHLAPGARRLTFLYVQNQSVQVCRWNDDAGRVEQVPLFRLESTAMNSMAALAVESENDGESER